MDRNAESIEVWGRGVEWEWQMWQPTVGLAERRVSSPAVFRAESGPQMHLGDFLVVKMPVATIFTTNF